MFHKAEIREEEKKHSCETHKRKSYRQLLLRNSLLFQTRFGKNYKVKNKMRKQSEDIQLFLCDSCSKEDEQKFTFKTWNLGNRKSIASN